MLNYLAILEGIISSVPEAIALFEKLAPLIAPRANITPAEAAAVTNLVPIAHAAVATAHDAIAALVATHTGPDGGTTAKAA
jgi:hypothetical protein